MSSTRSNPPPPVHIVVLTPQSSPLRTPPRHRLRWHGPLNGIITSHLPRLPRRLRLKSIRRGHHPSSGPLTLGVSSRPMSQTPPHVLPQIPRGFRGHNPTLGWRLSPILPPRPANATAQQDLLHAPEVPITTRPRPRLLGPRLPLRWAAHQSLLGVRFQRRPPPTSRARHTSAQHPPWHLLPLTSGSRTIHSRMSTATMHRRGISNRNLPNTL